MGGAAAALSDPKKVPMPSEEAELADVEEEEEEELDLTNVSAVIPACGGDSRLE